MPATADIRSPAPSIKRLGDTPGLDSPLSNSVGLKSSPKPKLEPLDTKKRPAASMTEASPKKVKTEEEPNPILSVETPAHEITEADMLMLTMKGAGAGWPYIHEAWEKKSGTSIGKSTLRKRYAAITADKTVLPEEDMNRLARFKQEIETKFEKEKWTRIADMISSDGGGKYVASTLQKKYKEMLGCS